jgi:hypothetical protein
MKFALSLLALLAFAMPLAAVDDQPAPDVIDIGKGLVGQQAQIQVVHLHGALTKPMAIPKGLSQVGQTETETITLNDGTVVDKETYLLHADAAGDYSITLVFVDAHGQPTHTVVWHCLISAPAEPVPADPTP